MPLRKGLQKKRRKVKANTELWTGTKEPKVKKTEPVCQEVNLVSELRKDWIRRWQSGGHPAVPPD